MFKSIFSKLITVFIAVLLFSFLLAGITLYYFLDGFVTNEKVEALEESGEAISRIYQFYVDSYINNFESTIARMLIQSQFMSFLEMYSKNTNSLIWLVDSNGRIMFSVPDLPSQVKTELRDPSGNLQLPDQRQYERVMSGPTTVKELGNFYGFFKNEAFARYGDSWLTVQKSFKYNMLGQNMEMIAAVYLHTPVPEVKKARTEVLKLFALSGMVSAAVSAVLSYIFSLRITKPLMEITNAAKVIAGGDFKQRIKISSNDEIGKLASSFNQMITALQNIEEMRRGFIANVSHELRTPMTSIRGFIEGILDGTVPPEKQKEYLEIVRNETDRLNRLVNDLLDLARREAGETKLNFKNFNINEMLRQCIIKLESMIAAKNIQVEANFEGEDIYVKADPDSIERVLLNLIHNAVKFTPERGTIKVAVTHNKDKVYVSVEDNGIGIDEDEIPMIWERFYKSDKSRSREGGGTGLGLAIVKNIINEHKQEIWVESKLGRGTKFTFTLDKSSNTHVPQISGQN